MMIDYTGQQIGSYRLVRRLGLGGFASVYLGQHMRIATKQAAIKLLHIFDVDSKKFRQEAETTAALEHPNIIHLIDFDFHDQMPFLVLEYAPGGSLRFRHPKGTQVPLPMVVQYVQEITKALEYAHSKNVIHRDIKPDNILIGVQGELRLSDFGIAVLSQTGHTSLVASSGVGGTAYYMAPEQSRGKPEKASDQYALGIIVYEWLCGKPPFTEGNAINIQYQHAYEPVPSLGEQLPTLPRDVEQVVQCALAKDPKERFSSVKAFALALEAACSDAHLSMHALSPEVVPQVPPASDSKMQMLDGMDNNSSSISKNIVAASEVTADIIAPDPIEKEAQQSPVPTTPIPQMSSSFSSAMPDIIPLPPPDTDDPAIGTGIDVIELLPSSQPVDYQPTAQLTDTASATAAASAVQLPVIPIPRIPLQWRNTGKTVVVTESTATASVLHGVGGSPSSVRGSNLAQAGTSRRKPRRGGLIAIVLIFAILLISGGVVIATSGLQLFHFGPPAGGNTASATITIMPNSKVEQDSYVIQAVTSNAGSTKRQVSLRQLTFSPQKQSKSVTATGVSHIAAKAAAGQLTFYNGSTQDYWIASTATVPGPNGVSVEPDDAVNVPASHPPTDGTITVNAHATTAGANGNMAAGAINGNCCASGGFITVVSSAFTGGQDQKDYAFVQQSDIDSVVNELKPALSRQALNGLKSQIKPNEQLASDAQCTVQPNVDQPIGDQGPNVTSANVTINATCTGLAYDASGAQTLAQGLLKTKATSDLGQGYVLAGTIMTKYIVTDVKDNVVTLQVAVAGTWYYQFDDQQRQTLAKQLVNKSRAVAQGLLNHYKGVAKASINIAGGGDTLPNDPKQITITVVGVSGASPTNLPALPTVEPTSPSSATGGRG